MIPIFLLSLPRSGSTLLQRMLAAHPDVATASEPWLLLPLFYAFRRNGISAEYEQKNLAAAMEDFVAQLPNGTADYRDAVRRFALELYGKAAAGRPCFLDKTPRYHLIVDELIETFPDAKVILLWRNPLAIAASMIETWGRGKWNLHWFRVDLYDGLATLVNAKERFAGRLHSLRFEDLTNHPGETLGEVCRYLELSSPTDLVEKFANVNLVGRMGDPTGTRRHRTVSTASADKWKRLFANPWRRTWARRYLNWIGPDRLRSMGYDWSQLMGEVNALPSNVQGLSSDLLRGAYGWWSTRFGSKGL